MVLTTRQVARELGTKYWWLVSLIRYGKIKPPAKNGSGFYFWLPEDVARVRREVEAEKKKRELRGMAK